MGHSYSLCGIALSMKDPPRYMASKELSLFSYEILGLVGRRGAAPHDLLHLAKRGRLLGGSSGPPRAPRRRPVQGFRLQINASARKPTAPAPPMDDRACRRVRT